MTQSPRSGRLVEQDGALREGHDPSTGQFTELVVLLRLAEPRPGFPSFQDRDRFLDRILSTCAQISTVKALDPRTLFTCVGHETDTDLGDREWQGIVHDTRAVARLYSAIK